MWQIVLLIVLFPIFLGDLKVDDQKLAEFLQKIKMLESSNGKDLNHKQVESGIQAGDSAYGSYGLMPNTIQELVNRSRINHHMDKDYQNIYNQDPESVKTILSARPDLEERLAKELAQKVMNNSNGDEENAAYRWKMGHNRPPGSVSPEDLNNNDYIKKFRALKEKLGN